MAITHRRLLAAVALLAVGAAVAVAVTWPDLERVQERIASGSPAGELIEATIVDVEPVGAVDQPGLPPGAQSVVLTAERADNGEQVVFPVVDETGDLYDVGDGVRLERFDSPTEGGAATYSVADFQRGPALLGLAALFVLGVVAFGRWRGVRALAGLGLTLAAIIGYVVPSLLSGHRPLVVALAAGVAIVVVTLYVSHGVRPVTTAAVVGTAAALAVTVALGTWFVDLTSLTGMAEEEARLANVQAGGINLRGLLLAGIIIGALGVLDDVTMTQSSTVFALRRADPAAGFRRLVAGALDVGRDHVAATVNTLFLAYAGASLPLLILFVTGPLGPGQVVTGELVAVEVVRTLVGSLGLIAAVPITTALAAALARHDAAGDGGPVDARAPAGAGASGTAGAGDAAAAPGRAHDPVGAALTTPAGARGGAGSSPSGDAGQAVEAGGDRTRPDGATEPGDVEGSEAEPGDADSDEPQEWEQRLRRSYGLDDDG